MKGVLLLYGMLFALVASSQEPAYDYIFFTNSRMSGDYFFSKTKATYPSSINSIKQRLPVAEAVFHTPGNSLQLDYVNGPRGNWQAIIAKPELRGQDKFQPAKFLSFWVYVPSANTTAKDLPSVQLMKPDSTLSGKYILNANGREWQRISIPVARFTNINLSNPVNCIAVVFSQNNNDGKKHTIYVDDIEFTASEIVSKVKATPAIRFAKGYAKHVDIEWLPLTDTAVKFVKIYRSQSGGSFVPVSIQSPAMHRFADYTGNTGVSYQYRISFLDDSYTETKPSMPVLATTKEMTDDELLTMVQEACFRYYWEGAEVNSGLAKENIPGRVNMVATGASGFGIMALIVGTQRGFITRSEAKARFSRIVNFLEKTETFHGAFSHFVDGPTAKVEPFFGNRDNGGDLVETSFLLQGLLAARAYFREDDAVEKEIREKITKIWQQIEWSWYRQFPNSKYLYWHWSPDQGWIINHKLIGWNETMITYLLAIASPTHPIPVSMYYSGWASQDSIAQQYRKAWGQTDYGSMYRNGNSFFGIKLDVGVSNGGPLFFTHYSYMGYDPLAITDKYTNYFTNNKNIALINYRYCVANPKNYPGYGDSCWGLTASDGPYSYSADEPVEKQDRGKIAPTGAISSFPYTPIESMKALKNYYNNYGKFLWGEYGFRDAFNLKDNWCSEIYMGLNQAPMVVMIENYRTKLLWSLLMSDSDVREGLKRLESVK